MGSEWLEKRKRQMQVHQEAAATVLHARDVMRKTPPTNASTPPTNASTPPTNASNACCFCWCCCCSCSCLTVRSDEETVQRTYERRADVTAVCEDSPRPTLDDARSWSMSFDRLMKSASGRGCFRQFLRTEFSEENMMFWLACEELRKETNKTVVEEKVSLDSRVREVINRNMLEPTSHTFEDAQKQIYTLMQRDSYPRFMNSSTYTDLLKDLEEPKTEP
ncbi:hypothetical protein CRUP_020045 [Coryphaenoides rupestris]|nr:hypothetical protein CRUP_020045 [Coryphaenoides rupestris]